MGKTFVSRNEIPYDVLSRENDALCNDIAEMIINRTNAVTMLSLLHDSVYFCDPMLLAAHQYAIAGAIRDVISHLQQA